MENKLYKNVTNNREELTQENYNICRNIQRKMVRSNLIPKDLKPSKEVYEELGFRFYPYLEDEKVGDNGIKIDVWYQIEPNLDLIVDYVIYKLGLDFHEEMWYNKHTIKVKEK